MILTFAANSGWYRVDDEGNVYTGAPYKPGVSKVMVEGVWITLEEGQRPIRGMTRYGGATAYWERTGQGPEPLTEEQHREITEARERRDALIEQAERNADRVAEIDAELAELLA